MNSDRIPDLLLERYALGELPSDEMQDVQSRLAAEEGGMDRLEALRADNARVLALAPPDEVVPEILRRVHLENVQEAWQTRQQRRRWMVAFAAPAAVLAAVLITVQLGGTPTVPDPGWTATKGEALDLRMHRQGLGGYESLFDGALASEGDVVQISYISLEHTYGVVLSIDGRGIVTLHHPSSTHGSTALATDGETALAKGYRLDDAPSFERFFLVASDSPLDVDEIGDLARELAASGQADRNDLRLDGSIQQTSFLLVKGD